MHVIEDSQTFMKFVAQFVTVNRKLEIYNIIKIGIQRKFDNTKKLIKLIFLKWINYKENIIYECKRYFCFRF